MKQLKCLILTIIIAAVLIIPAFADKWENNSFKVKEEPVKKIEPLPLLTSVAPENLINPEEGLGMAKYGSTIDKVESLFGRGELVPEESDPLGNSITSLSYKDKGLIFKFFNGQMSMVIIDKPGYGTKTGVQVGTNIGDLMREFGSKYQMEKSMIQDPGSEEHFEIYYKSISATVRGKLIEKIRIKTSKTFKQPK